MKFNRHIILIILVLVHSHAVVLKGKFNSEAQSQAHLRLMSRIKSKSNTFLHSLYRLSNKISEVVLDNVLNQDSEKELDKKINNYEGVHSSVPSDEDKVSNGKIEVQYNHRDFNYIKMALKELAKKYPNYMRLTTAQKEFKLPYPGGICSDKSLKKKCKHYIVYLTNHKLPSKSKSQIYISGTVHGNERVGPTATLELINLMLENRKNPFIRNLLNNRYIVITPMTNPYGYFHNVREELLIENEDDANLTVDNYEKYHKDINRDFPYLVDSDKCMETIGARVVNELFLKHIFSISLSLHGGTESLTYPFGVPNHIDNNNATIPIKYFNNGSSIIAKANKESFDLAKKYRLGKYDGVSGRSTSAPDKNAMEGMAYSSAGYNNRKEYFRYPIGDMSSIVYPVRGGMEDWAYSGSWEGYPIITQPCEPQTYNGYNSNKTLYEKYYKDALKSIMFLLEISHDKYPEQLSLGRKNTDCLLNLKRNAFFNKKASTKKCLDPINDGYIPRLIRLSLALIDMVEPYVNFENKLINEGNNTYQSLIKWAVGGSIDVNETMVLYDFVDNVKVFKEKVYKTKLNTDLFELFRFKSRKLKGLGIWNNNYKDKDQFRYHVKFKTQKKALIFIILAQVDSNWGINGKSDPPVGPQSHIANLRNKDDYVAHNKDFLLRGKKYHASKLGVIYLN